ncbi:uncharacterized protein EDB93DRAFT_122020 [Suillus bovinus]|uniref:uncharacterized protein n=1 Tax=Suillus bovinus TaxID=48563 RepID=UPI001B87A188|nr:uncharacterized protein EDB93DRAFT_122020 [Suillus bovinus]KAG2129217.1 hypothetical protein EDB93DRAFT_122020 [Suillus bovinus]
MTGGSAQVLKLASYFFFAFRCFLEMFYGMLDRYRSTRHVFFFQATRFKLILMRGLSGSRLGRSFLVSSMITLCCTQLFTHRVVQHVHWYYFKTYACHCVDIKGKYGHAKGSMRRRPRESCEGLALSEIGGLGKGCEGVDGVLCIATRCA